MGYQNSFQNYKRSLKKLKDKINEKKKELENIRNEMVMGSFVRSCFNEGDKPTNYFLNLENHHYTSKSIPKIILSEIK